MKTERQKHSLTYKQKQKKLCLEEAEKHLETLTPNWKAKISTAIYSDTFYFQILSECERVKVIKWHSNSFFAEMGAFRACGRTVKSAIKKLKQDTEKALKYINAEFKQPFPKF